MRVSNGPVDPPQVPLIASGVPAGCVSSNSLSYCVEWLALQPNPQVPTKIKMAMGLIMRPFLARCESRGGHSFFLAPLDNLRRTAATAQRAVSLISSERRTAATRPPGPPAGPPAGPSVGRLRPARRGCDPPAGAATRPPGLRPASSSERRTAATRPPGRLRPARRGCDPPAGPGSVGRPSVGRLRPARRDGCDPPAGL